MSCGLRVKRAPPKETERVVEILEEATQWVYEIGQSVWRPGQFRDTAGPMRLALDKSIEQGHVYLGFVGDESAGTFILQPDDPIFWPDAPDDALYIHKLAVLRRFAGRGVGRELIAWADGQAVRAGKEFLRLDTPTENPVLRRYYEEMGFENRGEVTRGVSVVLYERKAGHRG